MSISSSVVAGKPSLSYPRLMIGESRLVVMMVNEHGHGFVVHVGASPYDVGAFRDNWRIRDFLDFSGSVTLTNNN